MGHLGFFTERLVFWPCGLGRNPVLHAKSIAATVEVLSLRSLLWQNTSSVAKTIIGPEFVKLM